MNDPVWSAIRGFDFDFPASEYSFSLRLARENHWTRNYALTAIEEYKKFMYLAATSDQMVSPSGVIDIVWHQHLVFTESYNTFCSLIGKTVQHMPSTGSRTESGKFRQARERTLNMYRETFGPPPPEIWEAHDIFSPLGLPKARLKVRSFVIGGMLLCAFLIPLLYFMLKPVYVQINGPQFLIGYGFLLLMTFTGLTFYNRTVIDRLLRSIPGNAFIFKLRPSEVIYLKTNNISDVIHSEVSQLVSKGVVAAYKDSTIELKGKVIADVPEHFTITDYLNEKGRINYAGLLQAVRTKPAFTTTVGAMDAVEKYFIKSAAFGRLFYLNFAVLSLFFAAGIVRLATGIIRDKPVDLLVVLLLFAGAFIFVFLKGLSVAATRRAIPKYYASLYGKAESAAPNGQWSYLVLGPAGLASTLVPAVEKIRKESSDFAGNSSDSGSCGSSCSSCGGCGGD